MMYDFQGALEARSMAGAWGIDERPNRALYAPFIRKQHTCGHGVRRSVAGRRTHTPVPRYAPARAARAASRARAGRARNGRPVCLPLRLVSYVIWLGPLDMAGTCLYARLQLSQVLTAMLLSRVFCNSEFGSSLVAAAALVCDHSPPDKNMTNTCTIY